MHSTQKASSAHAKTEAETKEGSEAKTGQKEMAGTQNFEPEAETWSTEGLGEGKDKEKEKDPTSPIMQGRLVWIWETASHKLCQTSQLNPVKVSSCPFHTHCGSFYKLVTSELSKDSQDSLLGLHLVKMVL